MALYSVTNKEHRENAPFNSQCKETYWATMYALEVYQSLLHCHLLLFHFLMRHPLSTSVINC